MVGERACFISGLGAMGGAIARRLGESGLFKRGALLGYDPVAERVRALEAEVGLAGVEGNRAGAERAEVVVIAVKPGLVAGVLGEMKAALNAEKTVVSVAAGVPLSVIEGIVGEGVGVVRVMPNTPALIGEGALAMAAGRWVPGERFELVKGMLGTMGLVVEVAEGQMDAVTGLSGSGPAYVAVAIEALADGGVRMGLARSEALRLAAQTVKGTAQMLLEREMHPAQAKDMVTSPGGTTAAGLAVLEQRGLRSALIEAVRAAAERSREMGEQAMGGGKK